MKIEKITTEEVHISNIKAGDIILHYGEIKTLSPCYLSKGGFLGTSIWGDSYNSGYKLVKKVITYEN